MDFPLPNVISFGILFHKKEGEAVSRCIIACRTLERELNRIMKKLNCTDPVIWLDGGDHNVPSKRRQVVQDTISQCNCDTILLAMSFCGGALVGVDSGSHTLLLPCCDDCIGLLLEGDRQADTYYLTEGWLAGERNIIAEHRISLEKYGQARTDRIFAAMLRCYRYLGYIDTGCGTADGLRQAKEAGELLKLEFRVVSGTTKRLEELLTEKENDTILRIPPYSTITLDMRKGGTAHG